MAEWATLWDEAEIVAHALREPYDIVAKVKANGLDEVYYLTNNIESSWTGNEGVTPAPRFAEGCRSSSVGDVFYDAEAKVGYAVLPLGFSKPIRNLGLARAGEKALSGIEGPRGRWWNFGPALMGM
jgi:hypothetical protein